jgi:hypothetical protein
VIWLLLTGAGLVAETIVIVALGRHATAMTEPPRTDPTEGGGPVR